MPTYATYNPEFLYLKTTGRKSGHPHEIEIWFVAYENCYYLCAERREATHWVQNIQHNPAISFWVNGQTYSGTGHVIDPDGEAELGTAIAQRFHEKYQWRDGLFVQLCPDTP